MVLIVDVAIHSSMPTVDAVTDIGLDNTGNTNCQATLKQYLRDNYNDTTGMKIEFPSGTYLWEDSFESNTTLVVDFDAHNFGGDPKITKLAFVGTGATQPRFIFSDDSAAGGEHCFFAIHGGVAPDFDTYLLVRNLQIEMENDPDTYVNNPQFTVGGDTYAQRMHEVIEDCTLKNFGKIGDCARTIHRRNTITGCGNYNAGAGSTAMIRYIQHGLSLRNYIAAGDDGHSHVWYCSGVNDVYIVDNYADCTNAAYGKLGAQLKGAMSATKVQGNIIRNLQGAAVILGAYDAQAASTDISNNRFLDAPRGIQHYSSSAGITITDNFFSEIDEYLMYAGHNQPAGEAVLDVSFTDNIAGYDAPGGAYGNIRNEFDEHGIELTYEVTETNTTDNEVRFLSTDPDGWTDVNGYLDPGAYEYIPPTIGSFAINNGDATTTSQSVTLNISVTDAGSGMGSSARFPFQNGALMQFSNDGSTWSQVEPYATTHSWTLTADLGVKTVYARFRDVDGNWTSVTSDTIELEEESSSSPDASQSSTSSESSTSSSSSSTSSTSSNSSSSQSSSSSGSSSSSDSSSSSESSSSSASSSSSSESLTSSSSSSVSSSSSSSSVTSSSSSSSSIIATRMRVGRAVWTRKGVNT